jgi:hypothetical protein
VNGCGRAFAVGERVRVRLPSGIEADGEISRVYRSSGNYRVLLDRPLGRGRETYVEKEHVFPPGQEALFASADREARSNGWRRGGRGGPRGEDGTQERDREERGDG